MGIVKVAISALAEIPEARMGPSLLPDWLKRMVTVPEDGFDQVIVMGCPATALKLPAGMLM